MLIKRSSCNVNNEHHIIDGIEYKRCTKCLELRTLDKYGRDKRGFIGLAGRCRVCDKAYRDANKDRMKIYNREYREENKEHLNAQCREYGRKNKEAIKEYQKCYRIENKEKISERNKIYGQRNAKEIQKKKLIYRKNKYENNPHFKLNRDVAMIFRYSLKRSKNVDRELYDLGYTVRELKGSLIKTLPSGYKWDDYLSGVIQIDHKKPLAAFYYTSTEDSEFKKCWDINNLQLLLARDNLMKGVKYDDISEAS